MKRKQKTVVIGLSGGVDSAVAALMLKKQGYKVIAAFMKNFSDSKNKITGECNWVSEKKDAQKISTILKIPLVTFDFEEEYKKLVINQMFRSYEKGLTPNPDVLCNKRIKFPLFWKKAKSLGADYIAMGHYARIIRSKSNIQLLRGKDSKKDQSYFLYELTERDLEHTLFPIGEYTKEEIRKIAKKKKFPNHDKKGTRGICFVGKIDMKSFLKQRIKPLRGIIKNPQGEIIGKHNGITFYTIGERLGERIGAEIYKESRNKSGKKWHVVNKIKSSNTLIAAPEGHPSSFRKEFYINKIHLINKKEKIHNKNFKVRIRHLGELIPARIIKLKSKTKVILKKSLKGIAEGQNTVIYDKNRIVGGGEIRIK